MKEIIKKILDKLHFKNSDAKAEWLAQFIKFGLIGVTNTLLSYGIYMLVIWILTPYNISFDYLIGSVLGFIISVLWSFFWNNKLVFTEGSEKRNILKSLLKTYLSYATTGIVLSNILLFLFVDLMGISKAVAPFLGLLITVPLNFVLNKYWAFRKERKGNSMPIKNVIFDLDGTLLDTSRGIIESVEHTVNVMGFRALSEDELRSFIGPPLRKSFMNTCGCTEEQANEATRFFRAYYQKGAVLHAELYDGILELCQSLEKQGVKMGVATNKPERFAKALISNFGLDKYFISINGADERGSLSKTDLINLCMKGLNASVSDTALIGDTDNDALGAEQAGVSFVAVTYGFGFSKIEQCTDYPCIGTADSPMQIAEIINNIKS